MSSAREFALINFSIQLFRLCEQPMIRNEESGVRIELALDNPDIGGYGLANLLTNLVALEGQVLESKPDNSMLVLWIPGVEVDEDGNLRLK